MNDSRQTGHEPADALIDEVRTIRRTLCEQFVNDVDRLIDHLRTVERDYAARRGDFAGVSAESAASIAASWGPAAAGRDDAIIDEVRAIRQNLSRRRP